MADIRPKDLLPGVPTNTAALIFDSGLAVNKATPEQVVDAATPLASQAEAEAGADNVKRMTPLRTKQAIEAQAVSSTALAASSGSSLVGFLQFGAGAVARTAQAKARDTVCVLDFGADRTGTDDSTTAFQNALDTGNVVYAPAGAYKISSALNVTHACSGVVGDGYATKITTTSATADIFMLGDGANEIPGLTFRGFRVWSSVVKTAGAVFNGSYVSYARFENIGAGTVLDFTGTHYLWDGYAFDGFLQCSIMGGEVIVANDGVQANGETGQTWGAELSIGGGMRFYDCGKGLHLTGSAGGVYLGRLDMSLCGVGVQCDDTTTSETNRELFLLPDATIDTCDSWGLNVESNGLALLEATNAWIAGCGQPTGNGGARFAPGCNTNARWVGTRIYGNYGNGVEFSDGTHNFSGCSIKLNGRKAAGGYGILAAAFDYLSVVGVSFESNGNATLGRGLGIGAGSDDYSVQANSFVDTQQAPAINVVGGFTPSTTKLIRNNSGFITEAQGTAAITAGNTTVTVNHGLDVATRWPTITNVGHATVAYVQNLTSTTFQIAVAGAAGANLNFAWSASNV